MDDELLDVADAQPDQFLPVVEAQPVIGAGSTSTVRRWCRQGKIPHYRIQGRIVFKRSDLDRWLADRFVPERESA